MKKSQFPLKYLENHGGTYKDGPRKSDNYRKDGSKRGLNHIDKGSPAKSNNTSSMKSKDYQCS